MSTVELDPRTVPGAIEISLTRELPDGSRIDFESSSAGWLTAEGEIRRKDYRAYYFAPHAVCQPCEGTGRAPSEKRPGGKVKCQPCKGSGIGPRTRLASVSTLLDAICPKGGLPPWAEARGIEGAVTAIQRGDMPSTIDPREAVAVVRALKLGADRARDDAADRGLNIHALLEQYMRTGDAPDPPTHVEHQGYYQALCRWLLKVNPEPLDDDATGVEELVASPEDSYAGRRDLRARCGDWVIGFDAKTQERGGIFLAAHQQLRLYERAGIACGDDPCDWLKVVVFAANGEFREMDCMALDATVDAAIAYYREIKPIDAACARHNEIEKQARRS